MFGKERTLLNSVHRSVIIHASGEGMATDACTLLWLGTMLRGILDLGSEREDIREDAAEYLDGDAFKLHCEICSLDEGYIKERILLGYFMEMWGND